MTSTSWNEQRLATTRIDHVVVRLSEPRGGELPLELSGCEPTYQIGMWLSDADRPRGHVRYEGTSKALPLGRVNYVPAGIDWTARLNSGNLIKPALYCDFDPEFFETLTGVASAESASHVEARGGVCTPLLERTLWMMHDEVRDPGFAHALAVDGLSRLMLAELGRGFARCGAGVQDIASLAGWQITRIRECVEEADGRAVTLAELAGLCGVSNSHFRRLFKASTGMTITRYVEDIRLRRARLLLSETRLPLKQIAYRLGFSGPSAFSVAFKRAAGISPLAYRQLALH